MSFTHGEMGSRASVVEYEPHIFGLALVVIGVVNRHRDAEPSIGAILDERWPWMCVMGGVIYDVLVYTGYYDWRCGRTDAVCQWWGWRGDVINW